MIEKHQNTLFFSPRCPNAPLGVSGLLYFPSFKIYPQMGQNIQHPNLWPVAFGSCRVRMPFLLGRTSFERPPKHLRHLEQRYLGFSDPRRRNPNSPSFGPRTCSDRPQLGPSGDIFFFILNQASVMRSLPALVCACCLFLCETKPSTYFVTHFILTQ